MWPLSTLLIWLRKVVCFRVWYFLYRVNHWLFGFHGEASLTYAFLILLLQWLAKNIVKKVEKPAMLNSGSMLGKGLTYGGCLNNKHDIWECCWVCLLSLAQTKVLQDLVRVRGYYHNLPKLFVLRLLKWLFMIQDRWKVHSILCISHSICSTLGRGRGIQFVVWLVMGHCCLASPLAGKQSGKSPWILGQAQSLQQLAVGTRRRLKPRSKCYRRRWCPLLRICLLLKVLTPLTCRRRRNLHGAFESMLKIRSTLAGPSPDIDVVLSVLLQSTLPVAQSAGKAGGVSELSGVGKTGLNQNGSVHRPPRERRKDVESK